MKRTMIITSAPNHSLHHDKKSKAVVYEINRDTTTSLSMVESDDKKGYRRTYNIDITVPKGFKTDLGTVPFGINSFIPPKKFPDAATLHDFLWTKAGREAMLKGGIEKEKHRIFADMAIKAYMEITECVYFWQPLPTFIGVHYFAYFSKRFAKL